MIGLEVLQWAGALTGMAGAPLVAMRSPRMRAIGWVVWLLSDALWVAYGFGTHAWGLALNYTFFVATASWGLRNSLLKDKP